MKKLSIFLAIALWATTATAQVAKISRTGTTTIYGNTNTQPAAKTQQVQPLYKIPLTPQQTQQINQQKAAQPAMEDSTDNDANTEEMENNIVIKTLRGSMRNTGNQKDARNLMIVKAVADFKMGDEKLAKEFDELENNREYHEKLQKIMDKLSNKKYPNNKNKEVTKILQDAGNRIYNLLAN